MVPRRYAHTQNDRGRGGRPEYKRGARLKTSIESEDNHKLKRNNKNGGKVDVSTKAVADVDLRQSGQMEEVRRGVGHLGQGGMNDSIEFRGAEDGVFNDTLSARTQVTDISTSPVRSRIQAAADLGNMLLRYIKKTTKPAGPEDAKPETLAIEKPYEVGQIGHDLGRSKEQVNPGVVTLQSVSFFKLKGWQHNSLYRDHAASVEKVTLKIPSGEHTEKTLPLRLVESERLYSKRSGKDFHSHTDEPLHSQPSTRLLKLVSDGNKKGNLNAAVMYTEQILSEGSLLKEAFVDDVIDVCIRARKPILCARVLEEMRASGEPVFIRHLLSTASIFGNEGDISGVRNFIASSRQAYPKYFKHKDKSAKDIYHYLADLHAAEGNLTAARTLLEGMGSPSTTTYNTLMKAYLVAGQPRRALRVLQTMRNTGVVQDIQAYNTGIQACVAMADAPTACSLFDELKASEGLEPDAVTYNGVLKALQSSKDSAQSEGILREMKERGIKVDSLHLQGTHTRLNSRETVVPGEASQVVSKETALYNGSENANQTDSSFTPQIADGELIDVQSLQHKPQDVQLNPLRKSMLEEFKLRSGADAALNAERLQNMSTLLENGTVDDAIKHFAEARETDMFAAVLQLAAISERRVSAQDYLTAAQACEKADNLASLEELMAQMRTKHKDLFNDYRGGDALHCLIAMYTKQGRVAEARQTFNSIVQPRLHSYSVLMKAYIMEKQPAEVSNLLSEMMFKGVAVDESTYNSCLGTCASVREGESALMLLGHMQEVGMIEPTSATYDAVMSALIRDKDGKNTILVAQAMRRRGYTLQTDAKHRFVVACVRQKRFAEAAKCAEELLNERVLLPSLDVLSALRVFETTRKPQLGLKVLIQAEKIDMLVVKAHYAYLVESYASRSDFHSMRILARYISGTPGGFKPSSTYMTNMITSHLDKADISEVKKLLKEISGPLTIPYSRFMQAYTDANQPENVLELMQAMHSNGVERDFFPYTLAFSACAKTNNGDLAYALFLELNAQDVIAPTQKMYAEAVMALEGSNDGERADHVVDEIAKMINTRGYHDIVAVRNLLNSTSRHSTALYNKFMHAYARADTPDNVMRILEIMSQNRVARDLQSYQLVLSACRELKYGNVAHSIFRDLQRTGLTITERMYADAVMALNSSRSDRAIIVYSEMLKRDFRLPKKEHQLLNNTSLRPRNDSLKVFTSMKILLHHGVLLKEVHAEEATKVFISHGRPDLCERIVHEARVESNLTVPMIVYNNTASALAKVGDVHTLRTVVAHLLKEYPVHQAGSTATDAVKVLLEMYAQRGELKDAWGLIASSSIPQTVMYNVLIETHTTAAHPERVLDVLREMKEKRAPADVTTYTKSMHAWSMIDDSLTAEAMINEITALASVNDIKPNLKTHNKILEASAKVGDPKQFVKVLHQTHSGMTDKSAKEVLQDLISTKIKRGELRDAWKLAANSGASPKTVYNALLKNYISSAQPERVVDVLREMKRERMSPDVLTYKTSMRAWSMLGDLPTAEGLLDEVMALASVSAIKPNAATRDQILEVLANKGDSKRFVKGLLQILVNKKHATNRYRTKRRDVVELHGAGASAQGMHSAQTTEEYNAALSQAIHDGQATEANRLLMSLQRSKLVPNIRTYQLVLTWNEGADWLMSRIHMPEGVEAFAQILEACQHAGLEKTMFTTESRTQIELYTQMLQDKYGGMVADGNEMYTSDQYADAMAVYMHNNSWELALDMWDRLCESGVRKEPRVYQLATRACGRGKLGAEALRLYADMQNEDFMQIHGTGEYHLLTANNVINACAKAGMHTSALDVFRKMESRGVTPNYLSYRFAMSAFKNSGQWEQAFALFNELKETQKVKGGLEFGEIIDVLVSAGQYEKALDIYKKMHRHKVIPDGYTKTLIMNAYGANGQWQEALREFEGKKDIDGKDVVNTSLVDRYQSVRSSDSRTDATHLYNSMLGAFARSGRWREAVLMFGVMDQEHVHLNTATYAHVIRAFCEAGQWVEAEQVLKTLAPTQLDINHKHDYYVDAGAKELVSILQDLLKGGRWDGCGSPHLYDYLTGEIFWRRDDYIELLHAYRKAGRWRQCATHVRDMPTAGFVPCAVSYNMAIAACKEAGAKALDTAFDLFHDLQNLKPTYGVQPSIVTYNTMIAACAGAGEYARAESVFNDMNGMQRTDSTYSSIITACRKAGMPEKVQHYLHMLEHDDTYLKPQDSRAAYTSAIAAYAHSGLRAEALAVFDRMTTRGVPKDTLTYTNLLKACVESEDMDTVEKILSEMREGLVSMNKDTYFYTLTGYGRTGQVDSMVSTLRLMLSSHTHGQSHAQGSKNYSTIRARKREEGAIMERAFYNALSYMPVGTSEDIALGLRDYLRLIPFLRTTRIYSMMMVHLSTPTNWKHALQMFDNMEENGVERSAVSFIMATCACLEGGELPQAQQFLHFALTRQHKSKEAMDFEYVNWRRLLGTMHKHGVEGMQSQLELIYERIMEKSVEIGATWRAIDTTKELDLHNHSRALAKVAVRRLLNRMVDTLGTTEGRALRNNFRGFNVGIGSRSGEQGPVLNKCVTDLLEQELQPPIRTRNNRAYLIEMNQDDLDKWLLETHIAAQADKESRENQK
ncbi:hypothetical protein SARC_04726 [Sphaeroforma arctica JP610]|uniref:Pentacotripeptide-repeat region of PRORP domain-containing protein n=1 Tax=Sphaeroforma arctica JP610 TaxID=667725 RepID=A0A0L0G442_9EUKA|nr:hypothetical protein SARC_04726 [Sphaeroforma arctica JP610]KNC83003.1 hypothetical protein SARC_04726 [Sphaeroforma arctica JP610]|eukprot:XP_014156905.1 hypothetical protein SARC_04726 [Sphaeroforma arctica JP610]